MLTVDGLRSNDKLDLFVDAGVSPSRNRDDLSSAIDQLSETGTRGVIIPVYRTDHLVSNIHDQDQASELKTRQLDKEQIKEIAEQVRNHDLQLGIKALDRGRIPWIEEAIQPDFYVTHPGDITFKRLHEALNETSTPAITSVELAENPEIESTLQWHSGNVAGLLHGFPMEVHTSSHEHLDLLVSRGTEWDQPSGISLYGGSLESLSAIDPERISFVVCGLATEEASGRGLTPDQIATLDQNLDESSSSSKPSQPSEEINENIEEELTEFRRDYRRSLMAAKSISAGSTLSEDMIRELRPGGGLPADKINDCIGMLVPRPTDPQGMISYS